MTICGKNNMYVLIGHICHYHQELSVCVYPMLIGQKEYSVNNWTNQKVCKKISFRCKIVIHHYLNFIMIALSNEDFMIFTNKKLCQRASSTQRVKTTDSSVTLLKLDQQFDCLTVQEFKQSHSRHNNYVPCTSSKLQNLQPKCMHLLHSMHLCASIYKCVKIENAK